MKVKQPEYDLEITKVIKVFREIRVIKQSTLARALKVNQSTYSKIENGQRSLTVGQLYIVAKELDITLSQIIAFVDHLRVLECKPHSTVLIDFLTRSEDLKFPVSIKEKQNMTTS